MSNICVISKDNDLAELFSQQPVFESGAEVVHVDPSQDIANNMAVCVLMLEPDDAEYWLNHYQQKSPVIVLIPKKSEARFRLLCERWKEEQQLNVYVLTVPTDIAAIYREIVLRMDTTNSNTVTEHDSEIWQLNIRGRKLQRGEKSITLTEKEMLLLQVLLKHHPKPVSKNTLLEEVWQYGKSIDTHTLETHIYRLRQKAANMPLIVTTEDGYKLSDFETES